MPKVKAHYVLSRMGRNILVLISLSFSQLCSASEDSVGAEHRVTLHEKGQRIETLIQKAAAQAGLRIGFSSEIFKDCPLMDADFTGVTIEEFLNRLFAGFNFEKKISDGMIIISRRPRYDGPLYDSLRGRVLNSENEPLLGAVVQAVGSTDSVYTDRYGMFILPVNGFLTQVQIRCFGFTVQQLELSNRMRHDRDIVLQHAIGNLREVEVVPIGYGKARKDQLTENVHLVSGKDIAKQNPNNVMNAMQGLVPGLFIRRINGVSGSNILANLGGIKSITQGNEPLFIVDGMPLPSTSFVGMIGTGTPHGNYGVSPLNGILPENIASVSVLKGADATTIYGSRGANGVILISTRTSDTSKLRFSIDVSSGFVRSVGTSRFLNRQQFLEMRSEAVRNDGLPVDTTTVPELKMATDGYQDYQRMIMGRTFNTFNARVGVSSWTRSSSFLLSGTLNQQATVFPGSTRDRRQSINGFWHTQSADERLQLTASGFYSWQAESLPMEDLVGYMGLAPFKWTFFTVGGTPVWQNKGLSFANIPALTNNTYGLEIHNLLGHLQAGWKLTPYLTLETSLGFYHLGSNEKGVTTLRGQDPAWADSGKVGLINNDYRSRLAEMMVRYVRNKGWARTETVVGGSFYEEQRDSLMVGVRYLTDSLLSTGSGGSSGGLTMGKSLYDYRALFGRGKLIIVDRYILTISGRLDQSTRYGGSDQFGKFMSIGGAWEFTKESFYRGFGGLSYGKLRGNFGTTGNDQILTLNDPGLRWELNYNSEIGLDLAWGDQFQVSLVGYRSRSDNQVLKEGVGRLAMYKNLPVKLLNEG
ncbi:MAG TPA: TonB-dependent receptor plug domain-containing protein, partial [Puia sp.]